MENLETAAVDNTANFETVPKKKGLTGSTLKIIAIISMFIDHFAAIFISGVVNTSYPDDIASWSTERIQAYAAAHQGLVFLVNFETILRMIGRFGFPLFVFLLIEGFTHTHSVKKYIRNLAIFALISEIPFDLGFANKLFYLDYQNVFFTLLFGVITLACIKYLGEEKKYSAKCAPLAYLVSFLFGAFALYLIYSSFIGSFIVDVELLSLKYVMASLVAGLVGLVVFTILSKGKDADWFNRFSFSALPIIIVSLFGDICQTDYGTWGVMAIVIMYLLRQDKTRAYAFGAFALTIMDPSEVFSFVMLPIVKRYNGKRGLSLKYFFYAFYPAHILLIYLLTYFTGWATFAIK